MASGKNSSRIALPNQVDVRTIYADGPLAQPNSVLLQQPGSMQLVIVGGLSKVEALTGQLLASGGRTIPQAVDLAEAILAECRKRVQQKVE